MTTITADFILGILHQVYPEDSFDTTGIVYLQTLLQALIAANDVDSLHQWIQIAIPGELGNTTVAEMNKALIREMLHEDDYKGFDVANFGILDGIASTVYGDNSDWKVQPNLIASAINAILEYLTAEICELAGNKAHQLSDNIIFPWDIQSAISNDNELSQVFGIQAGSTTLPVTFTIQGVQHSHHVSMEFVSGLLLFSLVSGSDFQPTLFGASFDANFMLNSPRYEEHLQSKYSLRIKDDQYDFNTTDFMQGFATGSLWTNLDHHTYWSDLRDYTGGSEDGIAITF